MGSRSQPRAATNNLPDISNLFGLHVSSGEIQREPSPNKPLPVTEGERYGWTLFLFFLKGPEQLSVVGACLQWFIPG
jgi:hypothetical protein